MATKRASQTTTTKKAQTKGKAPGAKAVYRDDASLLAHCGDAVGLRSVKPGFALDAEHDRLFALGWPHVRYLVDGLEEDEDATAVARKLLTKSYPEHRMVWPREVGTRVLRGLAEGSDSEDFDKAISTAGAISEDEARTFVRWLIRGGVTFEYQPMLLLEAMLGPAFVGDAILAALEGLDEEWWQRIDYMAFGTVFSLGYILLRVPSKVESAFHVRMKKLMKRKKSSVTAVLDTLLGGAPGAERSGYRLGDRTLNERFITFVDDAAFVRRVVEEQDEAYGDQQARLVFLAGEPVIDLYATRWRTMKSEGEQRWLVDTLGMIRSAKVTAWLRAMSTTSKVKKAALEKLSRHRAT